VCTVFHVILDLVLWVGVLVLIDDDGSSNIVSRLKKQITAENL
jgi:hypothetical protein